MLYFLHYSYPPLPSLIPRLLLLLPPFFTPLTHSLTPYLVFFSRPFPFPILRLFLFLPPNFTPSPYSLTQSSFQYFIYLPSFFTYSFSSPQMFHLHPIHLPSLLFKTSISFPDSSPSPFHSSLSSLPHPPLSLHFFSFHFDSDSHIHIAHFSSDER